MKLTKLMATAAAGAIAMAASASAENPYQEWHDMAAETNAILEASGVNYRLEYVELYMAGDEAGTTVFFNNRGNKQLTTQFVPGDTRRAWNPDPNTINWAHDTTEISNNLTPAEQSQMIANVFATWDSQKCSDPGINGGDVAADLGVIIPGLGVAADIQHSGFFNNPATNVLGVHFGFLFIDTGTGLPTDINNDGYFDKAFGDIYYNDAFTWSDGGGGGTIDFETVALHETGHGFSQDHFGKGFISDANGKFHFAPRAVMNAAYTGNQRTLAGSDKGGHCSLWGSWPN